MRQMMINMRRLLSMAFFSAMLVLSAAAGAFPNDNGAEAREKWPGYSFETKIGAMVGLGRSGEALSLIHDTKFTDTARVASSLYMEGLILKQKGNSGEGEAKCAQALGGATPDTRLKIARAIAHAGFFHESAELLEEVQADVGLADDDVLNLAYDYMNLERCRDALDALLEKEFKDKTADSFRMQYAATCYLEMKEYTIAAKIADDSSESYSDYREQFTWLKEEIEYETKKAISSKAREKFKTAMRHSQLGETKTAIAISDELLAAYPDWPKVRRYHDSLLKKVSAPGIRQAAASCEFKKNSLACYAPGATEPVFSINCDKIMIDFSEGSVSYAPAGCREGGNCKSITVEFKGIKTAMPKGDFKKYNNSGVMLYNEGNYYAAVKEFTSALSLSTYDKMSAEIAHNMGIAYLDLNDAALAARFSSLAYCLHESSDMSDILNDLGVTQLAQDKYAVACGLWDLSLNSNPNHAATQSNRNRVCGNRYISVEGPEY
jgi:tetratricopeptide (TPR) repeat protein